LKGNEDQPSNLKTKPPKDLEWFATSKSFSHVEFEESIIDFKVRLLAMKECKESSRMSFVYSYQFIIF
jgi:hypothetical protein